MPDSTSSRPPFRRRLTLALGLALSVALAVVGVLVWLGASAWMTYEARAMLRAEAAAVEAAVVTPDGRLVADRYEWDEPHHRFAMPRIDPNFLQVFDAEGRLVRASDNLAALSGFPTRRLESTDADGPLVSLARIEAGGRHLYRVTEPLRSRTGQTVGYVQLARYDPGLRAHLGRLAAGLAAGLGLLLAALLALVWTVGSHVVRPLEAITAHAAALSATTLGDRIPVPPDADRETAALATALNDALERLDGSFAEMQRFTANAAHELQTPLTVLRGHVDVALRRAREPEAYRQTLRLLGDEVDVLTHTVRGLLALARLDVGASFETEVVDLASLARAEADSFRPQAEEKGLTLIIDAVPTPVEGHPDLLRDVARTLLDNAIKYTDAGTVRVSVGSGDGHARLVVADSGPGISPDHVGRVTDRFWRADDVQHVPGSGLGLAIAARIVERHEGRLTVGNQHDGGAEIEVTLPRVLDGALAPSSPTDGGASHGDGAVARSTQRR